MKWLSRFTMIASALFLLIGSVRDAAASVLSSAAAALQPGHYVEITTGLTGSMLAPDTQGNSILDWADSGVWDVVNRKFYYVGKEAGSLPSHDIVYDEASNSWSEGPSPVGVGNGHGYDGNTVDPFTGVHYFRAYNTKTIYKRSGAGWVSLSPSWTENTNIVGGLARSRLGTLFCDVNWDIYYPETGSYTSHDNTSTTQLGEYHIVAEYNDVIGKFFCGGGNGSRAVYWVEIVAGVPVRHQLGNAPWSFGMGECQNPYPDASCEHVNVTPDPVSGTFLVYRKGTGQFWSYNMTTDVWTQIGSSGSGGFPPLPTGEGTAPIAAPVSTYGVIMYVTHTGSTAHVYLYKMTAGGPPPTDTTPPTVSITSPSNGATINSTVNVNANASDDVGVVGVQFTLDDVNLGAEDTVAPYSLSWNTALYSNGTHVLKAIARDAATNSATSTPITVTVSNSAPSGPLSTSFTLVTATGGTLLPFTIGQPFKRGDVPSGSQVVGSISTIQVVPKNLWPDGSLKFGLISGRATMSSNTPISISLSVGTPTGGTALTTTDLKNTSVTASIGAGSFGSVTWAGTDFDTPFVSWVSGPMMSSWIYRKPVGSDANLVGWIEVRLYAGGAVEVLPWVENGYMTVAGPTDKNATYTFTLGGTQRFSQAIDLLNHQRFVLASGTVFSHWLGTSPGITPKHNMAYFQSTLLTPKYAAVTPSTGSIWTRMQQTYTPLSQSNYPTDMGATGYYPSIGPISEWDVAYMTSGGDVRAYNAIIVNAYCSGRYGIHFRDQSTNKPPLFSAWPNIVLHNSCGVVDIGSSSTGQTTTPATGGVPPTFDTPHHPSFGFMAYLVTGRYYFMEECEFSASVSFLKQNNTGRQTTAGILLTNAGANTTRGAAWSLRTLAQAAAVSPDGDALHTNYVSSFESNVNFYYNLYVATANNNTQGVCAPYEDYTPGSPPYMHSIWMEDFLTFAFSYGKDLVPISPSALSSLNSFLAWKFRSVTGRFGGGAANEYCYRDAAVYTIAVSPLDNATWNGSAPGGSWYSDWGGNYLATLGHSNDCNTGTSLRGSSGADPLIMTGYWANLRPALAYAVDNSASGAAIGWTRLTSASNYAAGAADMNDNPVWSVEPRGAVVVTDIWPPGVPLNLRIR